MLTVLSYCPKDQDQAQRLAELVCDLGGCASHSLLLVEDTKVTNFLRVRELFHQSFYSIELLPFVDHFNHWPEAPNACFSAAARHIEATCPQPWLWLEPDCVPLKPGWLDALATEYVAAKKPFLGAFVSVHTPELDVPDHMSGNGIYPGRLIDYAGLALIASDVAWDVAAASQIIPAMHKSELIVHNWKHAPFKDQDELNNLLVRHPKCVLFHADKSGSLYPLLRERMNLSGSCESRTPEATRESAVHADCLAATTGNIPAEVGILPAQPLPDRGSRPNGQPRELVGGRELICDVLVKSFPDDYEFLAYAVRSFDKFATGFRKMVIVVPTGAPPPPVPQMAHEVRTFNEVGMLGYLAQQTVKVAAHEWTDAPFILHSDSDVIIKQPITPETFFRNGKPIWLYSPYDKIKTPWQPITEKFLGEPVALEFMRRLPTIIPRSLHLAASAFCEIHHQMRLTDYILGQPHNAFSEFNALGALAWTRARDEFAWINTHP